MIKDQKEASQGKKKKKKTFLSMSNFPNDALYSLEVAITQNKTKFDILKHCLNLSIKLKRKKKWIGSVNYFVKESSFSEYPVAWSYEK